jgi:hypothetical protein
MSFDFGEPLDKGYVRFKEGWAKWIANGGVFRSPSLRWHPGKSDWFTYDTPRWEFIDRGISVLEPPTSAFGFGLAEIFKRVQAEAAKYPQWPQLVWNPFNGVWREARDTGAPPQQPPQPPKIPGPAQDAATDRARREYEAAVNAARDAYGRKEIDIYTLNKRLAEIESQYKAILALGG